MRCDDHTSSPATRCDDHTSSPATRCDDHPSSPATRCDDHPSSQIRRFCWCWLISVLTMLFESTFVSAATICISFASSDDGPFSGDDHEAQEYEDSEEEVRRGTATRAPTRWPTDKMIVDEIDVDGMPTDWKQKLRFRRLSGLIARQRLSLVMPNFKALSRQQQVALFDKYMQPYLEFPSMLKPYGFKKAMKTIAKAWRTHKSSLVRNFIAKGLEPFMKHPYIEREDWNEFLQLKMSEEAMAASERYRILREKNVHNHNMGPIGYDGKLAQWETEDSELSALGIENPWDGYPQGRSRNWLRARSELVVADGVATIKWKQESTEKVSEEMKEKNSNAESSGISWVREKDLLANVLGPEQPGRVRGLSSTMGWKHAWPEFSHMYRKRRRTGSVLDVQAIKDELREEVTKDVLAALASQGLQVIGFSRNPSPAPGRRSSCASASEAANDENNADPVAMEMEHDAVQVAGQELAAGQEDAAGQEAAHQEDSDQDKSDQEDSDKEGSHEDDSDHIPCATPDSIDILTEPTPCSLLISLGGHQIEAARGQVYPKQDVVHTVRVRDGYAVVKVEFLRQEFADWKLVPQPNDEITNLGQALCMRIQWKRSCIVVNPQPMDGTSQSRPQLQSTPPQVQSTPPQLQSTPPQVQSTPPQFSSPPPLPLRKDRKRVSPDAVNVTVKSVPETQQKVACTTSAVVNALFKKNAISESSAKGQPSQKSDESSKKQPAKSSPMCVDECSKQQQQTAKVANENSQKQKEHTKISQQQQQTTKKEPTKISQQQQQTTKVANDNSQKQKEPTKISQQQQPTKGSHKAPDQSTQKKKQPTKSSQQQHPTTNFPKAKKVIPAGLTAANPNYICGEPLLQPYLLDVAGLATSTLHNHYMNLSMAKKKKGLVAAFKRQHFLRSADSEFFYVGFSDVYELFNFDALDVSILRCYTLSMIKEARAKSFSVGFLDPEVMTLSTICDDKSYVVDYVTRAFGKYAKKKCIMFAHNPGNHWILIAIVPEWHKVLFLDSYRSSPRNHAMLKDVIDEAFLSYCSAYGMPHKKLTYVTKFPCHQQGCTQECGFYTAHHMRCDLAGYVPDGYLVMAWLCLLSLLSCCDCYLL
ncbi:hypothetical protein EJB05_53584, partial [Eragrostis curvula]